MTNIFLINIKPHNWDECRNRTIFGLRKGSFHPEFKRGDIFLVRLGGTRPNYGVKAIWAFENEKKVDDPSEVPWTDTEYEWILNCSALIDEFKDFFMEEFEGKSKYSDKVKLSAGRIIGAVIKLKPNEIKNYLEPLLKEKSAELKTNAQYLGNSVNIYNLLILNLPKNCIKSLSVLPIGISSPSLSTLFSSSV